MNSILKATRRARSKGFTLVEIMIVLAVLAVLAAVVVPNVAGFLGRGKERAFDSDRRVLQAAVDAWRTDIGSRGGNPWPTVGGSTAAIATACTGVVVVDTSAGCSGSPVIKLSTTGFSAYLKGLDAVKSFAHGTTTDTGATNSPLGSYVWYIDTSGLVQGRRWTPASSSDVIVNANELASSDGFVTDVYP